MQQWNWLRSSFACTVNVFRAVLKLFTDEELRMEHGNWFHAAVPATKNACSPNFVLVRWTTRSPRADDRVRPSTQDCSWSSDRYTGADPCIALYTVWTGCAVTKVANATVRESSRRSTCDYFPAPQSILAARQICAPRYIFIIIITPKQQTVDIIIQYKYNTTQHNHHEMPGRGVAWRNGRESDYTAIF